MDDNEWIAAINGVNQDLDRAAAAWHDPYAPCYNGPSTFTGDGGNITTVMPDGHDDFFDFEAYQADAASLPRFRDTQQHEHVATDQEPAEMGNHEQEADLHAKTDGSEEEDGSDEDDSYDDNRSLVDEAYETYFSEDPFQDLPGPVPPATVQEDLLDPPGSVDIEAIVQDAALDDRSRERWEVDKGAAQFLASVVQLTKVPQDVTQRYGLRHDLRDLKIEEPLLLSNPEADVRKLFERNEVRMDTWKISPFQLDVDKDESLEWSSHALKLPATLEDQISHAKLEVSKEDCLFLMELSRDLKCTVQEQLTEQRKQRNFLTVSPTLLPRSPSPSPVRLSSSAANIELSSTPEDPTINEAAAWEAEISRRADSDLNKAMEMSPISIGKLLGDPVRTSSSPLGRKAARLQQLKISSPILHEDSSDPPAKKSKTVTFREELETVMHLLPMEDWTDPSDAADEAMEELGQIMKPLAEPALRQLQEERLVEEDTTLRVAVPAVPDIEPTAPWSEDEGRRDSLIKSAQEDIIKNEPRWTGASKLEKILPWCPFPSYMGKVKPEEEFDDGSCARYLAGLDLNGRVDLQRLTYKADGFRLFDEDESEDDEIESGNISDEEQQEQVPTPENFEELVIVCQSTQTSEYTYDFQSPSKPVPEQELSISELLKRRRAELEKDSLPANSMHGAHPKADGGEQTKRRKIEGGDSMKTQALKETINQMDRFHHFLHTQGQSRLAKTLKLPNKMTELAPAEAPSAEQQPEVQPAPPSPKVEIPVPDVDTSKAHLPVIVSSSIISDITLIRNLEKILPSLQVVTRQYHAQQPSTTSNTSAYQEADITISPSTGLMLTTLQKLKQKPLPGQTSFFGIREQVAAAAPRYERLIVLVSEGQSTSSEFLRTLDDHDTQALADFTARTTTISCEVQITYIPGDSSSLVHWIAATISSYAPNDPGVNILEVETFWERFLRQAGMNAFAAQVVLGRLKASEDVEMSDSSTMPSSVMPSGLAAFVAMSEEERVQRFGLVLGGENVLRRVSRVIDARWKSAASLR